MKQPGKSLQHLVLVAASVTGAAGIVLIASSQAGAGALALLVALCASGAWLHLRATQAPPTERVLVLGAGRHVQRLLRAVEARPELGWKIVRLPDAQSHSALAGGADADALIREHKASRIIMSLHDPHGRLPLRAVLAERARGIPVEEAVVVWERLTGKVDFGALDPQELLFEPGFGSRRLDRVVTRLVCFGAVFVGLLIVGPLFPLIALAIKADSRGPVFFRQTRIGLNGKPFELVKFRTMHTAAEPHSEWENDNTARVTRVGGVLRRLHLDELPQLWNILRGNMNLVGPRPHPAANAQLFRDAIPFYELRSLVRPGLTGWAQVHYHYANNLVEETEKVRYDLYYLKHRSLWLDLSLIPATLRSMVRHRRAPDRAPVAQRPLA